MDENAIDLRLAARFQMIRRNPDRALESGSEAERLVAALLHDRHDWFPSVEMTALDAINRLRVEGPAWAPTLLALQASVRISQVTEMHEERLG